MSRRTDRSRACMEGAQRLMPGGVNSPVRSFGAVGGVPPVIERGLGARLWDIDGNEYLDYVGSWGPMILGHADPGVLEAVRETMARGTSFGAPTRLEAELAREMMDRMPALERVRMVNSGTEATLSAIRLARGATGRDRLLKFEGGYHGHGDSLLVRAGSGAATLGVPSSPGVPRALAELTLTLPYNDTEGFVSRMAAEGSGIAAVIVEPVAGNMGAVMPQPGFLEAIQRECRRHGAIFIVDEVMTGFRVGRGGACERFRLEPDLITLGKVIGGGFPVGAYGGRADLMDRLAPAGPIYQAGTLSGNPVAMAAGLAQLRRLTPEAYDRLEALTARLMRGIEAAARAVGAPASTVHAGSLFGVFLSAKPPRDFAEAARGDADRFARVFHGLLDRGIYWAPSRFEAGFVGLAHTEADIDRTADAFEQALAAAFG